MSHSTNRSYDERRIVFVDCPGNNCGDPLQVVLGRSRNGMLKITDWPWDCRSCRTIHHYAPELSQSELQRLWDEAESED